MIKRKASNDVDSAAGAAENRSEAASDEIPDTRSEEAQRASADLPEGRQVLLCAGDIVLGSVHTLEALSFC